MRLLSYGLATGRNVAYASNRLLASDVAGGDGAGKDVSIGSGFEYDKRICAC